MYFLHGFYGMPEHRIWRSMLLRCGDPANRDFAAYGGRGIKVCARWRADFLAFLADVGKRPTPRHSIDRIDNDGSYEPGNVRWATPKEQANNRRRRRPPVHTLAVNRNNTSGLKGVSWHHRARRWRATIKVDRKCFHLGCFDTVEDAHAAYIAAVEQYRGAEK